MLFFQYKPPTWLNDGKSMLEDEDSKVAARLGTAPLPPVTISDSLEGLPTEVLIDKNVETPVDYVPTENHFATQVRICNIVT